MNIGWILFETSCFSLLLSAVSHNVCKKNPKKTCIYTSACVTQTLYRLIGLHSCVKYLDMGTKIWVIIGLIGPAQMSFFSEKKNLSIYAERSCIHQKTISEPLLILFTNFSST